MTKLEKARTKAAKAIETYRSTGSEETHRTMITANNAVCELEMASARKTDPEGARKRRDEWEDALWAERNGLIPSATRAVIGKLTQGRLIPVEKSALVEVVQEQGDRERERQVEP